MGSLPGSGRRLQRSVSWHRGLSRRLVRIQHGLLGLRARITRSEAARLCAGPLGRFGTPINRTVGTVNLLSEQSVPLYQPPERLTLGRGTSVTSSLGSTQGSARSEIVPDLGARCPRHAMPGSGPGMTDRRPVRQLFGRLVLLRVIRVGFLLFRRHGHDTGCLAHFLLDRIQQASRKMPWHVTEDKHEPRTGIF